MTGPSVVTDYKPMIKIEKVVNGNVESTTFYKIKKLTNKSRIEICIGINGLDPTNVAKGTIYRFTPIITSNGDTNPTNPDILESVTINDESKTFNTQSFDVDLYTFLNGEEE